MSPGPLERPTGADFVRYQLSCPQTCMLCLGRSLSCFVSEVAQSFGFSAEMMSNFQSTISGDVDIFWQNNIVILIPSYFLYYSLFQLLFLRPRCLFISQESCFVCVAIWFHGQLNSNHLVHTTLHQLMSLTVGTLCGSAGC